MYVHLGDNVVIRSSEIIAIIDKKAFEYNQDGNGSYSIPKSEEYGIWKSMIVTETNIFFSPFTPQTIEKRIRNFKNYLI